MHANAAARGHVGIHASAACKPAGLPAVRYADGSTDEFRTGLVRAPIFQRPAGVFAATASNVSWTCTTVKAGPTGFAATTGSLVTTIPSVATTAFAGSTGTIGSPVAATYAVQAGTIPPQMVRLRERRGNGQ